MAETTVEMGGRAIWEAQRSKLPDPNSLAAKATWRSASIPGRFWTGYCDDARAVLASLAQDAPHGWVCYNSGPCEWFWFATREECEHELTDEIRPATHLEKYLLENRSLAQDAAPVAPEAAMVEMLTRDYRRMRAAGTALAEAALHVIREYDGLHRLSLAVAEWAKAVADEGDRAFLASLAQDAAPVAWEGPLSAKEQAMIDAAWETHRAAAPPTAATIRAEGVREGLEWRDISTAPKDGRTLLLGVRYFGDEKVREAHIGHYSYAMNDDEVNCWWSDQSDDEIHPAYWMPFVDIRASAQSEDRA